MKIDRLVSIVMVLLRRDRVGAQELAEMFEVSPRTIYRDIEAINQAGIPICSISGVGGGFEIMQNDKIQAGVFSTADLSAILMGLISLSDMVKGHGLSHTLAKVRSFVPADRAKEIEVRANQIRIDTGAWMGNRNIQRHLEKIAAALRENRLLSFEYTAHHGRQSARTVEPYQLVLKNSHWYFQGYCRQRNDFRLFRLSRITDLKIEKEIFAPREFQKASLDFEEIFTEVPIRIKLRIHQSVMDRVLDHCPYENFSPIDDECYMVDFPFVENDYSYDVLLGFGPKCECVEPPQIRAALQRRIRDLSALYAE